MESESRLVVLGNSTHPVTIKSDSNWKGIVITPGSGSQLNSNNEYVSGSVFSHVNIVKASTALDIADNLFIEHTTVKESSTGIKVTTPSLTLSITNLELTDSQIVDFQVGAANTTLQISSSSIPKMSLEISSSSNTQIRSSTISNLNYNAEQDSQLLLESNTISIFSITGETIANNNTFNDVGVFKSVSIVTYFVPSFF